MSVCVFSQNNGVGVGAMYGSKYGHLELNLTRVKTGKALYGIGTSFPMSSDYGFGTKISDGNDISGSTIYNKRYKKYSVHGIGGTTTKYFRAYAKLGVAVSDMVLYYDKDHSWYYKNLNREVRPLFGYGVGVNLKNIYFDYNLDNFNNHMIGFTYVFNK